MATNNLAYEFVRKFIREKSAIVIDPDKDYLIETRLQNVAKQEGLASLEILINKLQSEPFSNLHKKAIEAMTTNETSFFRDLHPFEMLKNVVLKEVIERGSGEKKINIWCAASSTGQEPYTIAMLLQENFPQLASWNVKLLATDLSEDVLAKAKQGIYSQLEVNRGLPASHLVKYFQKDGVNWQLKENIRKKVDFQKFNLMDRFSILPKQDIVFIRNVLIYFDTETKKQIIKNVRQLLEPNGYMFLGSAETVLNIDEGFERVQLDKSVCYRVKKG